MGTNKYIKSVSFNIDKEKDIEILKHLKDIKNFSGYVRELIYADLLRRTGRR